MHHGATRCAGINIYPAHPSAPEKTCNMTNVSTIESMVDIEIRSSFTRMLKFWINRCGKTKKEYFSVKDAGSDFRGLSHSSIIADYAVVYFVRNVPSFFESPVGFFF